MERLQNTTEIPIHVITNPYNHKREVYEALGFRVLDNELLYKIANEAEELYDEKHRIGFTGTLYPENGLGFPYPVEVAFAKLSTVREAIVREAIREIEGPVITTDVVWTNGEEIVNKPTNPEEAIAWWLENRGKHIYNLAGTAMCSEDLITLTATYLTLGQVNSSLPIDELEAKLRRTVYSNRNVSGGLTLQQALEKGIISHNGKIRWIRVQWPSFSIKDISSNHPLPINPSNPSAVDHGELSLTPENWFSIMGLLFGVEPR